jgi:acetyl esterase/lipase
MQRRFPSAFAAISMMISTSILVSGSRPLVGQETHPAPATVQTSTAAAKYTLLPAIPYAHPGGVELVADMYLPSGPGPFPAILFIHGGGWSSGDRTQLRRQAAYMAERGMVGMAIEYRLAPDHPFPAALDDSREALLWLHKNAAAYKIDAAHIGTVGSSAGGHLVAMLGVESAGQPNGDTSVQAIVALNGIFDLEAMPATEMISSLLGKPCAQAVDQCREASPIDHIRSSAPPFLVMHGDADQTAPYAQAKAFADKLRAAHDSIELVTIPGAPHTFWSKPQWSQMSDQRMATFLIKNLTR